MKKQNLLAGISAAWMLCCFAPMQASASGSVEDVYAAMREIGLTEAMVQQAKNQYETIPHDSEGMEINGHYATYDAWAEYVYIYEDTIWEEITKQFAVSTSASTATSSSTASTSTATSAAASSDAPSSGSTGSTAGSSAGGSGTVTAGTTAAGGRTADERKSFINMTLEEKKNYVASLPAEEQEAFLRSLSTAERNSIIKQLDTDSQSEIAQGFIALAQQLGMNITVDSIGKNGIDYSVRDGEGNLIDASVIGTQVDDTGWDMTAPILGSCGAILFAVGGMTLTGKKAIKREEAEEHG